MLTCTCPISPAEHTGGFGARSPLQTAAVKQIRTAGRSWVQEYTSGISRPSPRTSGWEGRPLSCALSSRRLLLLLKMRPPAPSAFLQTPDQQSTFSGAGPARTSAPSWATKTMRTSCGRLCWRSGAGGIGCTLCGLRHTGGTVATSSPITWLTWAVTRLKMSALTATRSPSRSGAWQRVPSSAPTRGMEPWSGTLMHSIRPFDTGHLTSRTRAGPQHRW
mmetsp:Transcript_8053/g.16041  ORF Transcript_8053/g.16041 Transcript_8053/m.16041 type:complete len:219 (-) Transcript_8053:963-1619(-)